MQVGYGCQLPDSSINTSKSTILSLSLISMIQMAIMSDSSVLNLNTCLANTSTNLGKHLYQFNKKPIALLVKTIHFQSLIMLKSKTSIFRRCRTVSWDRKSYYSNIKLISQRTLLVKSWIKNSISNKLRFKHNKIFKVFHYISIKTHYISHSIIISIYQSSLRIIYSFFTSDIPYDLLYLQLMKWIELRLYRISFCFIDFYTKS